jgi:hypothetical protein
VLSQTPELRSCSRNSENPITLIDLPGRVSLTPTVRYIPPKNHGEFCGPHAFSKAAGGPLKPSFFLSGDETRAVRCSLVKHVLRKS